MADSDIAAAVPYGPARLVLDSVGSPLTRRVYATALGSFFSWWEQNGRPAFSRATVQAYRAKLDTDGAKPAKVNQHLTALRRLAREAASNGVLSWDTANSILDISGVKERGSRLGTWLTAEQVRNLLCLPDAASLRGKRDRAVLGLLVGCGLRRSEVSALTVAHLQQREGRAVIVDLRGKHGRVRSVAVPSWVEALLFEWTAAAAITEGFLIRSVNRYGSAGASLSPQAVLDIVSASTPVPGVRPHDLRRTCAKLCRSGGADLEQIQLLLGHASVTTTERYLGTRQNLKDAPNDRIQMQI
jgi:site-specific recombinase XerD